MKPPAVTTMAGEGLCIDEAGGLGTRDMESITEG